MLYLPINSPVHTKFMLEFQLHLHRIDRRTWYAYLYGNFEATQVVSDLYITYCAGGEL